MKDIYSGLGLAAAIVPVVLTGANTSSAVDLQGFNSALAIVNTGVIAGAGDFTIKLQESDTTTGGDFTDVADVDLLGAFPASLSASAVIKVGYTGIKRYLRTVDAKNGGTSIAVGAVIVQGHPADAPVV